MTIQSTRFGELLFTDSNWFAALSAFLRLLEQEGYLPTCNGARKDAYGGLMRMTTLPMS